MRLGSYVDEWTKKPFSDVFVILSNNTYSRADLNYEMGNYKNIHYGDVLIKFPSHISATDSEVPFISVESEIAALSKILLKNGDVVIADTAEDYTVGKATEIEDADKVKVVSGLHTIPCRPRISFAKHFLGHYINSTAYQTQLIPYIQGVKVSSISKALIKNTAISFPSIHEQNDIAIFLSKIDERIKTQNKIISKYETLIKGICTFLFSRMKTDCSTLKAIAKINKGQQINGLSLSKSGNYYYLNGGTTPSGFVENYNTLENTISISEGGNSCGFVSFNIQKFWSGGHCYTLTIENQQCRPKYLYFYLKFREKDIMQLRVGSGLPNIQKKSLENFPTHLPSYKKQCYVEHILENLTKKKDIENALLEQFQSQKKYLLNKMFI